MRLLWLILLPTAFAIRRPQVKSLRRIERDKKPVSPPLNSNFPPTSLTGKGTKTPLQSTVDVSGLIECADGLETFEDLNKELCKAIEKDGLGIIEASMILSNHQLFQTDQLPLIETAIKEGYNCYLKCMLNPQMPWAQKKANLHWYLAKSHGAPWDVPDLWLEYQKYISWADHLEAIVKADNVKFIEWLKKSKPALFKKLRDSSLLDGWIEKHDSTEMAQYFKRDLHLRPKGLKSLVQHGCLNIITMLVDNNVHLDLENVTLRDAYRYPNVLRLLYQNGFRCYPPLDMVNLYAGKGRTDYLDIFHEANKIIMPTTPGICDAAREGHLTTLQWIDQHSPEKLKYLRLAYIAIEAGQFEVFKWVCENKKGRPPTTVYFHMFFREESLEIFKWIYEKFPSKFDRLLGASLHNKIRSSPLPKRKTLLEYIVGRGRLDILEWIVTFHGQFVLNNYYLTLAATKGHLHILKWAYKRNRDQFVYSKGLDKACSKGFLEILRWTFEEQRRLPTMEGIRKAAKKGHLKVLQWIYKQDSRLFPDQDCIEAAAKGNYLDVLRWIKRHTSIDNITVHPLVIETLIKAGNYMIIKWIADTKPSLLYRQKYIDLAIAFRHGEIARFIRQEVFPVAKEASPSLPQKSQRRLHHDSSSGFSSEDDLHSSDSLSGLISGGNDSHSSDCRSNSSSESDSHCPYCHSNSSSESDSLSSEFRSSSNGKSDSHGSYLLEGFLDRQEQALKRVADGKEDNDDDLARIFYGKCTRESDSSGKPDPWAKFLTSFD